MSRIPQDLAGALAIYALTLGVVASEALGQAEVSAEELAELDRQIELAKFTQQTRELIEASFDDPIKRMLSLKQLPPEDQELLKGLLAKKYVVVKTPFGPVWISPDKPKEGVGIEIKIDFVDPKKGGSSPCNGPCSQEVDRQDRD